MAKKDKSFDCVEMMHRGAERVQEEIKGMTPEQELAYWRKGTERLRRRIETARRRRRTGKTETT